MSDTRKYLGYDIERKTNGYVVEAKYQEPSESDHRDYDNKHDDYAFTTIEEVAKWIIEQEHSRLISDGEAIDRMGETPC